MVPQRYCDQTVKCIVVSWGSFTARGRNCRRS